MVIHIQPRFVKLILLSYPQSYEPSALHEYSQSLNSPPDEVMMLDLFYSEETELEKLSNLLKVI